MRSRMFIICERHVWRDEHVILNGHACRNEDEWANLAVVAYRHSFFNIDVRIYLRVLSYLTTVKVHLIKYTRPVADTFFFFKQKTAYEIGLGIPAEPLFRSIRLFLLVLILLLMPTLNFLPVWFALSLLRFRLPSRLPMMFILRMVAMMVVIIPSRTV